MNVFVIWNDAFQSLNAILKLNFAAVLLPTIFICATDGGSSSTSVTPPSAERHYGSVGAYNYTYYNFVTRRPGASLIILKTLYGDADLYVSQRDNKHQPTFALDNYDFHSISCGLDYVEVEDLSLPVNIGIYGHPSYPFSNYSLAILVTKTGGTLDDLRRWLDETHLTIDDLPEFIEKYASDDEDGYNLNETSFGDLCWKIIKFLFELVLEILI